ncbi:FAD-binding oxidoreductase [Nonomuraea sp. NPDC046570]|uniref:FAD-binding oxidoreductase n=1 Tax=Nonomuraea sp. NPDC046570 TaxID=3155255 RepID=UPI0033F88253
MLYTQPAALRREFGGAVHLPGERGYDEQRRALNPALDPRPALVAEAGGPADVRAAVLAAGEDGLALAVQATGHGTHAACDGALLLKTTKLAAVTVAPVRRVARVGPGALWGHVLEAAAPYGLAPLAGSSPTVGVTGFTLGGGVGWLSRRYGFAADSVLRAEVVTADGRHLTATPDRHPDLFWALRGGGGNFGVVTSLEFRLYPVAEVYAGIAYFPFTGAAGTLAAYRDWAAGAPREMSTALMLTTLPGTSERAVAVKAMYAGSAEHGRRLLAPLWAAAGPVLAGGLNSMGFAQAAMGGTPARHLDLFETLPDPVIDTLVAAGATVEVRHWGGAMADPGPAAGPVGHRNTAFSVIIDAQVPGVAEALRPYAAGGSFLNFLSDTGRTATAYTATDHHRLRQVKRAYDPSNLFRTGHTIDPA